MAPAVPDKAKAIVRKVGRPAAALAVSGLVALLAHSLGLDRHQIISVSIFIVIIMATLLFWQFRLAIAFVGIGALMGTNVLTLPAFIRECKLDVILFLVGMMVTAPLFGIVPLCVAHVLLRNPQYVVPLSTCVGLAPNVLSNAGAWDITSFNVWPVAPGPALGSAHVLGTPAVPEANRL